MRPEAADEAIREDAERAKRDQRRGRRDDRGGVVPGAARHADRGDEPQSRSRRETAHREALPDDRAGAEEADARDDLRRDPRRVRAYDVGSRIEEGVEAIGADDREQVHNIENRRAKLVPERDLQL